MPIALAPDNRPTTRSRPRTTCRSLCSCSTSRGWRRRPGRSDCDVERRSPMTELSMRTLMLAIGSLALERSALLERLKHESLHVDNEEHLSERVQDIDQALSELGDEYD